MITNCRLLLITTLVVAFITFAGRRNAVVADTSIELDKELSDRGLKTDSSVIDREAESIRNVGWNHKQMKDIIASSAKQEFQTEVARLMKLIINSIYRNKEIFLRELISNASDALAKIRDLSLTDKSQLAATEDLKIYIKADKENHMLHIIDTGIGMTKQELIGHLGTIAKSGTAEFLEKIQGMQASSDKSFTQDMIGQFGVGFYSAFLVSELVSVKSKSNDDPKQHIWVSDATSFSIVEDSEGDSLKRGTQVSLSLKESAYDFLDPTTLKNLIKKYSGYIGFNIYLWSSKTVTVEEPEQDETTKDGSEEVKKDDDGSVEDEKEEPKPKTKKIEKTVWDWELINDIKPIWKRKSSEITDKEYNEFYTSTLKDSTNPLAYTHFVAEGEVTFQSLLYIPSTNSAKLFQSSEKNTNIKVFVRSVFIGDEFDMVPSYLAFIKGLVDSDDLPLNVSRETLQQNKLLKIIKKKIVRKILDAIKKLDKDTFDKFWAEYSTNIKLGVIEDQSNRVRLSKLLRFVSSAGNEFVSLSDYVSRMKKNQDHIYYIAGSSLEECQKSPFVERLLKKGYEVLYLTDAVDEYCVQAIPDFDGKKFQNVAKEGLKLDQDDKAKEKLEQSEKEFKPLLNWLEENALKGLIEKAAISQRLTKSPCALVASTFGWSGNMERLMKSQAHTKSKDSMQEFYLSQKKTLEINTYHALVKELLERVKADKNDKLALSIAKLLFETATIRGGFMLKDSEGFADRIESMLKTSLHIDSDLVEDEIEETEQSTTSEVPIDLNTDNKPSTDEYKPTEGEHIEL